MNTLDKIKSLKKELVILNQRKLDLLTEIYRIQNECPHDGEVTFHNDPSGNKGVGYECANCKGWFTNIFNPVIALGD